MTECQHRWQMDNIKFGFLVFERCFHCHDLRTFFTENAPPAIGDEYREGDCHWHCAENAQSISFDLRCTECGHIESFHDLMGLLHCTGCIPECRIDVIQKTLETEKTWLVVAFGFLPREEEKPYPEEKIDILTDYFNQRRDTSRSKIKVVSYDLINDISMCRGELIHDIGMLSKEEVTNRESLF